MTTVCGNDEVTRCNRWMGNKRKNGGIRYTHSAYERHRRATSLQTKSRYAAHCTGSGHTSRNVVGPRSQSASHRTAANGGTDERKVECPRFSPLTDQEPMPHTARASATRAATLLGLDASLHPIGRPQKPGRTDRRKSQCPRLFLSNYT